MLQHRPRDRNIPCSPKQTSHKQDFLSRTAVNDSLSTQTRFPEIVKPSQKKTAQFHQNLSQIPSTIVQRQPQANKPNTQIVFAQKLLTMNRRRAQAPTLASRQLEETGEAKQRRVDTYRIDLTAPSYSTEASPIQRMKMNPDAPTFTPFTIRWSKAVRERGHLKKRHYNSSGTTKNAEKPTHNAKGTCDFPVSWGKPENIMKIVEKLVRHKLRPGYNEDKIIIEMTGWRMEVLVQADSPKEDNTGFTITTAYPDKESF